MRYLWTCLAVASAASVAAAAAPVAEPTTRPAATRPAATQPAAETPKYMAGLDPNGLGEPEDLVRRRWDAVMRVLRDDELDQKAKQAQIERIVSPIFDFPVMARLALGRTHWRKLTDAQRETFTTLFVDRLRESYGKRVATYEGEEVVCKPALAPKRPAGGQSATRPAGPPSILHVPVEIVSKTRKWVVLHKFHRTGRLWRIYDVEIEGVSILRSYRSQFNDLLRRGTVEELLDRLGRPTPERPEKPDR